MKIRKIKGSRKRFRELWLSAHSRRPCECGADEEGRYADCVCEDAPWKALFLERVRCSRGEMYSPHRAISSRLPGAFMLRRVVFDERPSLMKWAN